MQKRTAIITRKQVGAFIKPRPHDSHKGMFGTVAVIGGDSGMVGAPLLAARAALKLGAGCVHVGLLAQAAPVVDMVQPELMLHTAQVALKKLPLPPSLPHGEREATPFSLREKGWEAGSVLVIGCGMGTSLIAQKLLTDALKLPTPLVLDADALNLLARHAELQEDVRKRTAPTIITPHPGEAARLLGIGVAEVQTLRSEAAQQLASRLSCTVVLKGADSVCVTRDGKVYLNNTGNPGMSAPGMGDVLTGMIAACIAQGINADDALLLAVHLHGAAGGELAKRDASVGMAASELIDQARILLNHWGKSQVVKSHKLL